MAKRFLNILFIFSLLLFGSSVYATTNGIVNCTDPLRLRSSINTSNDSNILTRLSYGDSVSILNTNAGSNGACSSWYQVSVKKNSTNYTGYICGEFITINSSNPNSNVKTNSNISDNIYVKSNYDNYIDGDGTVACYEDTSDWTLSSSPRGASTGVHAKCGDVLKINDVKEFSDGNCRYYYHVTNKSGQSGYLCGYYVSTNKLSNTATKYYQTTESLDNYYNFLRGKGFPESYLTYLAEIHARHPNWIFEVENINIDFGEAVSNESFGERNLLQGSAFDSNYLSTNYGHYDVNSNTFTMAQNEDGWYNASTEAIAFYMDPRNYLNEKYIFAFETLRYKNTQTRDSVYNILSRMNVWNSVYNGYSSSIYDDVFNACSNIGISPIHIASRIKQEMSNVGSGDARFGGGFYYNNNYYSGFYNFYNIAVYGTNKIVNGMVYAMNHGWNTPYNAVYGGAAYIYNDYVEQNQDTMYYEKFDISSGDGNYTHQYMQNLSAAISETHTKFLTYISILPNYYNSAITFTIPVYKNMSNYAVTSPKLGNPNNYLKDIKINGNSVSGFNYDSYDYSISLFDSVKSINVEAFSFINGVNIKGIGNIDVSSKPSKIYISATGLNGKVRNYNISISYLSSSDDSRPSVSIIMNQSGVKYNQSVVYGLQKGTNSSSLVSSIKGASGFATINIYDKYGNLNNNGTLKTGDYFIVGNGIDNQKYEALIYGDVNGDGLIDKLDYLAVLREYYGYAYNNGVYHKAADANRDGKVDKLDYLAILRDYYGYGNINQY